METLNISEIAKGQFKSVGVTAEYALSVIENEGFGKYVEYLMDEDFDRTSMIVERKGMLISVFYECEDGVREKVVTFNLI